MIYFILSATNQKIKIGYTKNPATLHRRIKTFSCGNPDKLEIVHTQRGDRLIEARLHREFGALRCDPAHEWFWYAGTLYRYLQKAIAAKSEAEF